MQTHVLNKVRVMMSAAIAIATVVGSCAPSFAGSFRHNHPRRAEVLGRDANLSYSINKDEGHLSGQYGTLNQEDHQIVRQEQADARANGGYITTQQQQQLNQEENQLRSQVQQDYTH